MEREPLFVAIRRELRPNREAILVRVATRNVVAEFVRIRAAILHAVEDGTIRAVAEFARIRALLGDSPNSGEFSYEPMPTACGITAAKNPAAGGVVFAAKRSVLLLRGCRFHEQIQLLRACF